MTSTKEFFNLADLIGSVGIAASIGLSERLAASDPLLARLVSSILTVESRHDAFFRHVQGEVPNPAPFDTGINDIWAYNLALSFIVPGSCPIEVPVPILPVLTVEPAALPRLAVKPGAMPPHVNSTHGTALQAFTWDPAQMPFTAEEGKQLLAGWVNQVNVPVYTPLKITANGTGTTSVPSGLSGIAFAVVTTQQYDNVNDLALGTMAGPAVVPIS